MSTVLDQLRERMGAGDFSVSQFRDNTRLHVAREGVFDLLQTLKQHGFDMLVYLTAVDYL